MADSEVSDCYGSPNKHSGVEGDVERTDLTYLPEPRDRDARLLGRLEESRSALIQALERGLDHWIVTFSGGKDSTATTVLALETGLELGNRLRRIDVVYADTLLEISRGLPQMGAELQQRTKMAPVGILHSTREGLFLAYDRTDPAAEPRIATVVHTLEMFSLVAKSWCYQGEVIPNVAFLPVDERGYIRRLEAPAVLPPHSLPTFAAS